EAEALAEKLVRACEALLASFDPGLDTLELFRQEPDQDGALRYFCAYASPYLSRIRGVTGPPPTQVLGMRDPHSEAATEFAHDVQQACGHAIPCAKIADDSVVLYQEEAGIPVRSYARLNELGAAYDRHPQAREAHIDFAYFRDRLPELRA